MGRTNDHLVAKHKDSKLYDDTKDSRKPLITDKEVHFIVNFKFSHR